MAHTQCLAWPFLCALASLASLSPCKGHQSYRIRVPSLRQHLTLIVSLKDPPSKTVTLRVSTLAYEYEGQGEWGRYTIQSITSVLAAVQEALSPLQFPTWFFFFFLHWVFLASCGLSLIVAASRSQSLLQFMGFLLQWLLLLWSIGSRHVGSDSCNVQAQLLCSMWDFPEQELNPCPLHWQTHSYPLYHQGNAQQRFTGGRTRNVQALGNY